MKKKPYICEMSEDVILTKQSVAQIQKDIGEIKNSMEDIRKDIGKKVDWKYFVLILAIGGILFAQINSISNALQETSIRMERIETKLNFYSIKP